MVGIVEWNVGEVKLRRGKFCFDIEIELYDSIVKQQKGGYVQKREAVKDREKIIGALYSNKYPVYANTKVRDFYEFWLEDIKKATLSYNSYNSYRNSIKNYILPLYGDLAMGKLRKNHIKRIYKRAYSEYPSVAKIVKGVLTTSLKYAFRYGYMEEDYVTGLKWRREIEEPVQRKEKRALTINEIEQLVDMSKDTEIGLPIMFAVLMGMRRGEIVGLKYSDIDYETRTIHIQRQLGRSNTVEKSEVALKTYTKQEISLKTPASKRKLYLPDMVFDAIMNERKRYERRRSRRRTEFQDLDYIYSSSYGRPRTSNYLWKQLRELIQEHDLPYMNWKILRYTYATTILKAGYSLKSVSKTLGHTKKGFTADHYVDMKELIRDCQPDITVTEPDKEMLIWDWDLTEEMAMLL